MVKLKRHQGFTLVELLVVIVVIVILAAVSVIAYKGVTARAHVATLQSDLDSGRTTLGVYRASHRTYPTDQATANLIASSGDTLTYTSNGSSYCLQASGWGSTYYVTSAGPQQTNGTCPLGNSVPAWASYAFTGGSVTDSSGNGNNLTYSGGTLETTTDRLGVANNAMLFDTNSGFMYTSEVSNPQVFTINVWFDTAADQYGQGGGLVGFDNQVDPGNGGIGENHDRLLWMDPNGTLTFGVWDDVNGETDTVTTSSSYNDGHWHMATVTLDGSTLKLYVDSVLVGSTPTPNGAQPYDGYWLIGENDLGGWEGDASPSQAWFEGNLDDVSIYTSALSDLDVSYLYTH